MKRFILFCTLFVCIVAGAQVIDIPDANLKNLLLSSAVTYNMVANDGSGFIAVDANADGDIDQEEADEVRELYLDNQGIETIEGLQYFTNLELLHVSGNSLTEADMTGLEDLEELLISNNQLSALTVAGLHHLQVLDCSNNQLTVLTFGSMEYLETVNCSGNSITQLDLSECFGLINLSCANNALTYINIKNGAAHNAANPLNQWGGNAGLAYMCIDDNEAGAVNSLLAANGYTGVVANSFCSFIPGGIYNTINGVLTFDIDENGCAATDPSQRFMKVTATSGTQTYSVFTDGAGYYDFFTLAGDFNVTPGFEEDYFTATLPAVVVNFDVADGSMTTANFCVAANGTVSNDIEIVMAPVVAPVPGSDAVYKMVYKNKGNQVLSGSVQCTWDFSKFNFYGDSFTPNADDVVLNGNMATYVWDYANLEPFESREITILLGVHGPADAVPVNVGDALSFAAEAFMAADVLPADNNNLLLQEAVAAVTPASVTCLQGGNAPATLIGEYLYYVVNFTNDGAQTADNIVVETDFDPEQFDVNSLQVLNSSHTAVARVNGNTARFIMQAATLTGGGHGTILFKAKTRNNLTAGSSVSSAARVFYDYNGAVDTNMATTVFALMGTGNVTIDASVVVYPNPADSNVTVQAHNAIQVVNLYDVQGRLLQTVLPNNTQATLSLSGRAAGIYFVKVHTANGVKVEKVVKE
jgi:uncharacterized repeat protein (TIGR01451 family)